MQLHTIGIDLRKTVFHLVGVNPRGEVVVRKKSSRKQLLHFELDEVFAEDNCRSSWSSLLIGTRYVNSSV
jgi:hypothetical protein